MDTFAKLKIDRPFLPHWDHLYSLECKRKAGAYGGKGWPMIKQFIDDIGRKEFLKHAKRTEALLDIARYYEVPLFEKENDVD